MERLWGPGHVMHRKLPPRPGFCLPRFGKSGNLDLHAQDPVRPACRAGQAARGSRLRPAALGCAARFVGPPCAGVAKRPAPDPAEAPYGIRWVNRGGLSEPRRGCPPGRSRCESRLPRADLASTCRRAVGPTCPGRPCDRLPPIGRGPPRGAAVPARTASPGFPARCPGARRRNSPAVIACRSRPRLREAPERVPLSRTRRGEPGSPRPAPRRSLRPAYIGGFARNPAHADQLRRGMKTV